MALPFLERRADVERLAALLIRQLDEGVIYECEVSSRGDVILFARRVDDLVDRIPTVQLPFSWAEEGN